MITSRLAGPWPEWGEAIRAEAARIGTSVCGSPMRAHVHHGTGLLLVGLDGSMVRMLKFFLTVDVLSRGLGLAFLGPFSPRGETAYARR